MGEEFVTMKRLCIICEIFKEENEFSQEHIFPEAIGNKQLKIKNVCIHCNTKILSKIDVFLTDNILTKTRRQWYTVAGKKGYIPNPFSEGILAEDYKQKVRTKFDKSGKFEIEFLPLIIRTQDANGLEHISITIDKNKEEELPSLVNKILERRNLNKLSEDELIKKINLITNEKPKIVFDWSFNKLEYKKAIIKIAYELGFFFLGDNYIDDETGEQMRLFLNDNSIELGKYKIYGNIDIFDPSTDEIDSCLFDFLHKLRIDQYNHIAYINGDQTKNKISIVIKIFDIFSASIVISENLNLYKFPDKDLIIINPQNGKLEIMSIEERILNLRTLK